MIQTYKLKTGEIWQIDASLTAFGADDGFIYRGQENISSASEKENPLEIYSTPDRSAGIMLSERDRTIDFFGDNLDKALMMSKLKRLTGVELELVA